MPDSTTWLSELIAMMRIIAAETPIPISIDGIIVQGSWNAAAGTVDVLVGTTAAIVQTQDEGPLVLHNIQLSTDVYGMQAGPKGGERCVLEPGESGFRAKLEYGTDDSPGAPSGEFWYINKTTGATLKYTLSGNTPGDGLGGVSINAASMLSASTAGGNVITASDNANNGAVHGIQHKTAGGMLHKMDDAAQKITHEASSTVYTIVDGYGNAISQVAPAVGLGALYSSLASTRAVMANNDLQEFAGVGSYAGNSGTINYARAEDLIYLVQAMIAAGVPNAGAVLANLATLVGISVPSGSGTVRCTP